jgi:hypothetical protein
MTKLAANPNYGRPSAAKQIQRMHGWRMWARSMAMLRSIHAELEEKLQARKILLDEI